MFAQLKTMESEEVLEKQIALSPLLFLFKFILPPSPAPRQKNNQIGIDPPPPTHRPDPPRLKRNVIYRDYCFE